MHSISPSSAAHRPECASPTSIPVSDENLSALNMAVTWGDATEVWRLMGARGSCLTVEQGQALLDQSNFYNSSNIGVEIRKAIEAHTKKPKCSMEEDESDLGKRKFADELAIDLPSKKVATGDGSSNDTKSETSSAQGDRDPRLWVQTPELSSFPAEILERIVGFADQESVGHLFGVSRSFNSATNYRFPPQLHKNLTDMSQEQRTVYFEHHAPLSTLDFSQLNECRYDAVSDSESLCYQPSDIQAILEEVPNPDLVRKINLECRNIEALRNPGQSVVQLNRFTKLEWLNVLGVGNDEGCSASAEALQHLLQSANPLLRELDADECAFAPSSLQNFSQLRVLIASSRDGAADLPLSGLISNTAASYSLRTLDLSGYTLDASASLNPFKVLENLDLHWVEFASDCGEDPLRRLLDSINPEAAKRLRRLNINGVKLGDVSLGKLTVLETLKAESLQQTNSAQITAMVRSISAEAAPKITEFSLIQVGIDYNLKLSRLDNLQTLNLRSVETQAQKLIVFVSKLPIELPFEALQRAQTELQALRGDLAEGAEPVFQNLTEMLEAIYRGVAISNQQIVGLLKELVRMAKSQLAAVVASIAPNVAESTLKSLDLAGTPYGDVNLSNCQALTYLNLSLTTTASKWPRPLRRLPLVTSDELAVVLNRIPERTANQMLELNISDIPASPALELALRRFPPASIRRSI